MGLGRMRGFRWRRPRTSLTRMAFATGSGWRANGFSLVFGERRLRVAGAGSSLVLTLEAAAGFKAGCRAGSATGGRPRREKGFLQVSFFIGAELFVSSCGARYGSRTSVSVGGAFLSGLSKAREPGRGCGGGATLVSSGASSDPNKSGSPIICSNWRLSSSHPWLFVTGLGAGRGREASLSWERLVPSTASGGAPSASSNSALRFFFA